MATVLQNGFVLTFESAYRGPELGPSSKLRDLSLRASDISSVGISTVGKTTTVEILASGVLYQVPCDSEETAKATREKITSVMTQATAV